MKRWIVAAALSAAVASPAAAEKLLARLTAEQLQAAVMPEGVQIETSLVDGEPAVIITNTRPDPVSVQLAEIALGALESPRLSYDATVSSENLAQKAYLELWMVVKGQAYFSRALNDTFSGTEPRRRSTTPFFLQSNEVVEAARLGLRFEGPGSVTLSGMELWQRDAITPGGMGMWGGIAGSIVGISAGIWGAVTSYYVSRGRARGVVLAATAAFAIAGHILLLLGGLMWLRGAGWDIWFTCVLLGGIVAIVESGAYYELRARYRQSEERRMLAMDMQ